MLQLIRKFLWNLGLAVALMHSLVPPVRADTPFAGTCSALLQFIGANGVNDDTGMSRPGISGWTRPDFAAKVLPGRTRRFVNDKGQECISKGFQVMYVSFAHSEVIAWSPPVTAAGCTPCACGIVASDWTAELKAHEEEHKVAFESLAGNAAEFHSFVSCDLNDTHPGTTLSYGTFVDVQSRTA